MRQFSVASWCAALCLTAAAVLVPTCEVYAWFRGTILSESGFIASVGPTVTDPAVAQVVTNAARDQLSGALTRVSPGAGPIVAGSPAVRRLLDTGVPVVLHSKAFGRVWTAALSRAHSELLDLLRHRSALVRLSAHDLDIEVRIGVSQLLHAADLPARLGSLLPRQVSVHVPLIAQRGLQRAERLIRVSDGLHLLLLPLTIAFAACGLSLARRRMRAAALALAVLMLIAAAARTLITLAASRTSQPAIAKLVQHSLIGPLQAGLDRVAVAAALLATATLVIRILAARRHRQRSRIDRG